jgi:hypothetical protein
VRDASATRQRVAVFTAAVGVLCEVVAKILSEYIEMVGMQCGKFNNHAVIVGASLECVQLARDLNKRMPVVMITNHTEVPNMAVLLASGVHVLRGVFVDEGVLELINISEAKMCFLFGDTQSANVSLAYTVAAFVFGVLRLLVLCLVGPRRSHKFLLRSRRSHKFLL